MIPDFLNHLLVWRDLPVPYTIMCHDGTPDFRCLDIAKVRSCSINELCSICGKKLGEVVTFIGGEACHKNHIFSDGPMHEACAIYAAKTCPFLNGTKREYAEHKTKTEKKAETEDIGLVTFDQKRPRKMAIFYTRKWESIMKRGTNGVPMYFFKAGKYFKVDWDIMPVTE